MSKRGENIFKRKDGRWEARYEKARNAQGRIIYGFCYGRTYKEAKDKVRQAKMDILLGNVSECQSKELFCRFLDEWLVKKRNTIKHCFCKPPASHLISFCGYPWELTDGFDELYFKADVTHMDDQRAFRLST